MRVTFPTAILASLALVGSLVACALATSPFAPEEGLLVLKNGQVIEGGILREGDRYVVTLGPRGAHGELKVPVADVDIACQSLDAAYQHKLLLIKDQSVKPHIELADWCLRHGLVDRASDELVTALTIDPRDAKVAALEQRIKTAESPPARRTRQVPVLPPTADEIEATVRTVPREAIEQFTTDIQPLLLSRCAVTACHGPSSTAQYRLVKPPPKHVNKTRETQRNLFATLSQIDPGGDSPLLSLALKPHGGAEDPILDQHDRRQIEQLSNWIERVQQSSSPKTAKTKTDGQVRPVGFEEAIPAEKKGPQRLPKVEEPGTFEPSPAARPLSNAGPSATDRKKPKAVRDPFDARNFNEKYHPDAKP